MSYTQEQIDRANQVNLEEFLRSQGEQLIKSGSEWRWKRHDSMTVKGNKWFRHSQSKGGYPVEFVMEFFGKSFPEAVELLIGEAPVNKINATSSSEFRLPPRSRYMERAMAYLRQRNIPEELVQEFCREGLIYEDAQHHNIVFVGKDAAGIPRYAHCKGTSDGFRMDVLGSDTVSYTHLATGWDCPRAHILVKLRDNMSETFEIQTIGRIRRMPEAKHYDCDLLDCCYLFTLDEKFTESVKLSLGKDALEAYRVFLKSEHRSFTLISEYKTNVPFPRDAKLALKVISKFFEKKYHTTSAMDKNKTLLEAHGYSFAEDIIDYTKSGEVSILSKENISGLNDVAIHEPLNTHKHGKAYHHCVAEIGFKINLDYSSINAIIRKLFLQGLHCDCKILKIDTRALYALSLIHI